MSSYDVDSRHHVTLVRSNVVMKRTARMWKRADSLSVCVRETICCINMCKGVCLGVRASVCLCVSGWERVPACMPVCWCVRFMSSRCHR